MESKELEALRKQILKTGKVRMASVTFSQKMYSNGTSSPIESKNQEIVEIGIDDLMSLVTAEVARAFMWQEYTGDYTKQYYDIRLFTGTVYENCWPNAGTFHEGTIGKVIEGIDVAYIRAKGIAQPHAPLDIQEEK